MNYDPSIFTRVNNLRDAKRIILTDEAELSTDQRWERETPHICDLIDRSCELNSRSVVLDYGCGVGRISRELIRRHGCDVIGADISPNMRALAASYVASDRFAACHPDMLDLIYPCVDLVIAVWVLQHVAKVGTALAHIRKMLAPSGRLLVVNEGSSRFVPTASGWIHDGIDVQAELDALFRKLDSGKLDPGVVGQEQSDRTFWSVYAK